MAAPWPQDRGALEQIQHQLADEWRRSIRSELAASPRTAPQRIGACFVCFGRGGGGGAGSAGDRGWAAAALFHAGKCQATAVIETAAQSAYVPGLLALREGPLLETALLALPELPDLVLVPATGRDHPRRAGLALHLGARLGVATVGVTNRLLLATGDWPGPESGSTSPFRIDDEIAGFWVRTRAGVRPVAAHAGWRTTAESAAAFVLDAAATARTPSPLRTARRVARQRRAAVDARRSAC